MSFLLAILMAVNPADDAARNIRLHQDGPLLADQKQSDIPPIPIHSPATWVNANDYPLIELREGNEGVVGFRLKIGPDGVPIECKIIDSSGHDALDSVTCASLMLRARFHPGLNRNKKTSVGYFNSKVRWQIPKSVPQKAKELPKAESFASIYSIEMNKTGQMLRCQAQEIGAVPIQFGSAVCNSTDNLTELFNITNEKFPNFRNIVMRVIFDDNKNSKITAIVSQNFKFQEKIVELSFEVNPLGEMVNCTPKRPLGAFSDICKGRRSRPVVIFKPYDPKLGNKEFNVIVDVIAEDFMNN